MKSLTFISILGAIGAAGFVIAVPEWTFTTGNGVQIGPPPTSMVYFSKGQMQEPVSQEAPKPLPPAEAGGPSATSTTRACGTRAWRTGPRPSSSRQPPAAG